MNKKLQGTISISLFIASILVFSFTACKDTPEERAQKKHGKPKIYNADNANLKVYIVDSCEYIGNLYWREGGFLTHKGNCKFCNRQRKDDKASD